MDTNNSDNTIISITIMIIIVIIHVCVCVYRGGGREDSVGQFPQYMIYIYIHSLARLGFSVSNWVEFPDQATAQAQYWVLKPQWIGLDLVFIKH